VLERPPVQAAYLRIAVIHADGGFVEGQQVDVLVLQQRAQAHLRDGRYRRAYLPLEVYAAVDVLVYLALQVDYPGGYLADTVAGR